MTNDAATVIEKALIGGPLYVLAHRFTGQDEHDLLNSTDASDAFAKILARHNLVTSRDEILAQIETIGRRSGTNIFDFIRWVHEQQEQR